MYKAMEDCVKYLESRFKDELSAYELHLQPNISYRQMIEIIQSGGLRVEFDRVFDDRTIRPDGGVILLKPKSRHEATRIVLVSEAKKQGTNEERIKEGHTRQAQGNAIERLGKNLAGIRAMMNHEYITPFVCFGWGCDFVENYGDDFVMSKISMMNEFYRLNKIYVYKRDGDGTRNRYAPVSMYFREEQWTREEMFNILKEVGEDAIRYYLH